ncbi:MAG: response regulator [Eubacterium sp.]|nr:response regulator [Eubacterium sp.]
MKKGFKRFYFLIMAVTVLVFVVIIATNANVITNSMKGQIEQAGQSQINIIKTDFENYIANAENSLIRVSGGAEPLLMEKDRAKLEEYIIEQKKDQILSSKGVNFNVYIAGQGWEIIPDFDAPDDYHATERSWYVGAVDNKGEIYITDPYIDRMTGEMCFTMSCLLSDGETVVAMDYTLSEIQQSIEKMTLGDGSSAMIATEDGLIVGYSDMTFVGEKLETVLPEYARVFNDILDNVGEKSFKAELNGTTNTIFYSITKNKWYMVLVVDNDELYSAMNTQIITIILINVIMLALIVLFLAMSIRNRIRSEEAVESREKFVNNLLENLREPLENILRDSEEPAGNGAADEKLVNIRNSGVKMNEIMKNLKSYSSIVSNKDEEIKREQDAVISKSIRYIRNIIIVLLSIIMISTTIILYSSNMDYADSRMTIGQFYYANKFNSWESEQKTILNMFADSVAAQPDMMNDYDKAVAWMDSIAQNYPGISVCYLANPYSEHTVIMNNGWQPDSDWKVEERDWYRATEKSKEGYSISDPYLDEQTGNYCITMSRMVYGKNGEFIGIFGIDFYMDKIIEIFGQSYTSEEYVFLVDSNGVILNHPYDGYQMSETTKVNVKDTPYIDSYNDSDDEMRIFRDYDGRTVCCKTSRDEDTGFSMVLIWDYKSVYLFQLIYILVYGSFVLGIIIAIIILMNKVIRSQANMNRQLTAAVEEATVAGKAKSDFLAQMSHEIRTPINAVIGMDEMILRETADENVKEYARDIKSASNTLLTLINGILDFSKIESGKMEIVPVNYNTADIVDDMVNMIQDRAIKKNLSFVLDIDKNLPRTLFGDDVRLKQVITNLLTNAVKYTRKGSVFLIIRGERITKESCTLYVEVKDSGMGIKKEDMDKLFQSFQRLDEKKNRTIEGTGLGMSIVDGILKLMGSSIKVESEYGKGSSFYFRVDQKVIDPTPLGEYQRHMAAEENAEEEKQTLKIRNADILVVDDNEMNLKVVKGLMKKLSVVPELADSGRKAIEMVAANYYDIILMDHMMPEMDGIETLKELRERNLIGDGTAVIALTANAIAGAREMYIEAGFKDYLSKPIDPHELESMLVKYLPEGRYTYGDADDFGEKTGDNISEGTITEVLRGNDFNVESAVKYCMDDKDFYNELLQTFVGSAPEKVESMNRFYKEESWREYQIEVHALKSASKTIGADKLSEMALRQEEAARAGDEAAIHDGFEPMMKEYARVTEIIRGIVEVSPEVEEDDDMEIMEFSPEGED